MSQRNSRHIYIFRATFLIVGLCHIKARFESCRGSLYPPAHIAYYHIHRHVSISCAIAAFLRLWRHLQMFLHIY